VCGLVLRGTYALMKTAAIAAAKPANFIDSPRTMATGTLRSEIDTLA